MEKYYLLLLIILFSFLSGKAQNFQVKTLDEKIIIQAEFKDEPYIMEDHNVINYYAAVEENKFNFPILPSKTILIAIPPESKIKFRILNENIRVVKNVLPKANPKTYLLNDSTLNYVDGRLDILGTKTAFYPTEKFVIEGYTWLRNYYCAVIRINTHRYNWQSRQVSELTEAKLEIEFYDVKPFSVRTSPIDDFEKTLEKVILNFSDGQKFRSSPSELNFNDSTGNWIDYSMEYVKLQIPTDGIYRIDYNEIINFGVPPSINPKTLKIFFSGIELPLFVYGEEDNSFDPGDYIEFWGTRNYHSPDYRELVPIGVDYLNYLDIYSDTSIVWLTWDGNEGFRVLTHNEYINNLTDSITSHKSIIHLERDTRLEPYAWATPRSQLPFWQENKAWMWTTANSTGTRSIGFNAINIVMDSQVFTISRLMSSFADQIIQNAHRFAARLNSSAIQDTVTFDFETNANLISVFNSNDMINGDNNYRIVGIPNDSATFHRALLDWVDIEYFQYTSAINDSLLITIPDSVEKALRVIKVSNFNSDTASTIIYKISNDSKKITSFKIDESILTFTDTLEGGDKYFVLTTDFINQPNFLVKKKFLNLREPNNQAEYIIITHISLNNSVTDYKNFIESYYNLNVENVLVEDIYDEFGYGYLGPESIREFLKYASFNWESPKPYYLLLVGDCTYDYKELWSTSKRRKIFVPSYGLPVSDTWFTMWDTTSLNVQQMLVGRIPANSNKEVYRYLEKHQTYIAREFDDWNKNYLLFSGGFPDDPGEMEQIKQSNERVLTNVIRSSPVGGEAIHFYKTVSPPTNLGPYTAEEIRSGLDYGGLFISYVGHSGTRTWDNGISEPIDIQNAYSNRLPLISDNGCSTGKFAEPDIDAFGELFLNQDDNGQAICYLGNSSWGYTSTAFRMPEMFYNRLITDSSLSFGQAHFLSKMDNFNQSGFGDVNRVYNYCNILLGDPVIKFAFPDKPNFVVNQNSVKFSDEFITDTFDSIDVKIVLDNWGRVIYDSLDVEIESLYSDSTIFLKQLWLSAPFYKDSLELKIPVLGLAGEHKIKVKVDKNNFIEEVSKNDNSVGINFNVYSTKIRPIEEEYFYNTSRNKARILNPTVSLNSELTDIEFVLSTDPDFATQSFFTKPLDSVVTEQTFSSLLPDTRYYWRARILNGEQEWSPTISFFNNYSYSWLVNHSFNDDDIVVDRLEYDSISQRWKIKQGINELKITSAGYNDGNYASILYNLTEYLPNTLFRGFATAMIDTSDLRPFDARTFVYPVTPSRDSLISYLNNVSNGSVITIVGNDEVSEFFSGAIGDSLVRILEDFGSVYVDSIGWRDSWAMLCIKGNPSISISEVFSKRGNGPAVIDTSKFVQINEGAIHFPPATNTVKWLNVIKDDSIPAGALINYYPLAYKDDGSVDTLSQLIFVEDQASIEFIDAEVYRKISILAEFNANSDAESPELKSIGINFIPPPDLAINYQVVSVSEDSVLIGEDVNLKFYVYNVGKTSADSFKVLVELIQPDNSREIILNELVTSLLSGEKKIFEFTYNTSDGAGQKSFEINIDPDKTIYELFEDNNFFSIPFYVRPDTTTPTITLTFDGNDILDGDFISPEPEIHIELFDQSLLPISDPSSVLVYLNDDLIPSDTSIINYIFSTENPKVTVDYSPALPDGDYTLKVLWKDVEGNIVDSSGVEKYFQVSSEAQLLYVYNYPNPTSGETYFTFKLTQVPDELQIKIYTIAGRMIKEIDLNSSDLKFDFNKIYWDGKDEDGDSIANGVYLYKVIMQAGETSQAITQKLAIVK